MKRIVCIAVLLFAVGGTTDAFSQGWAENLGKKAAERAEKRAKQKVEDKVNKTVDKAVDKAFEDTEDAIKGNSDSSGQAGQAGQAGTAGGQAGATDAAGAGQASTAGQAAGSENAQPAAATLEMTYAKSDFVAGDEIIFEDNLAGEQLGEFPSQWDLVRGVAEVASIGDTKAIYFEGGNATIAPLMEDMKNYLPDVFTIELDFWMNKPRSGKTQGYTITLFRDGKTNTNERSAQIAIGESNGQGSMSWNYNTPDNDYRHGDGKFTLNPDALHHLAISFNKRALKIYVDGIRIANVPSVVKPTSFSFHARDWGTSDKFNEYVTNVRIAKGAVPLYDRMLTDGKFITYGITFDVGKSAIKPESMGEINRIVKLMTDNPELKFSVEGHTDNTGSAPSNQTLSEARSESIVAKLIDSGVAADRLIASGKGQNNPIADNATDEGRAKNRRVEFVKQ